MKLHLIRHAQSENNALPEEQRVHDPGLTDLGTEQASRLASWIPTLALGRLISSPFLRAMETASALLDSTDLVAEVRVDLHEAGGCYQGHLPHAMIGQPGMTRQQIGRRFPQFLVDREIDDDGWWKSRPQESFEQARIRASGLRRVIPSEFAASPSPVALVMHADIMMLLLEPLLPERYEVPHNSSVTTLNVTPDEIRLMAYNRVDHLPADLLSI